MRARGFVRALAETRAGDSASGHWVAETAWPLPVWKTWLTGTAAIVKSGFSPLILVLQPEWPASTEMLARLTVPTR